MEDPVVPLERHLYGHPLAGLLWENVIWENPIEIRFGESFQLGMSLCSSWKRIILICVCGWHQIGWKETQHWSDVESTHQRSWCGRTNTFLDHVYLGCTQRQCEISKDIVDNYRTCLNPECLQVQLKNFHARKIWVSLLGLMIWKVMPRNVWNDIVSWRTRRLNNSTKYQLHSMPWRPSLQRGRIEICRRIVKKYPLKLFWSACTWHVLEDLIFYGQ